jgi:hypothetical protein
MAPMADLDPQAIRSLKKLIAADAPVLVAHTGCGAAAEGKEGLKGACTMPCSVKG